MTTYAEKLLDPRWQKKRLQILNRKDFHCERCGDGSSTLHVHHLRYIRGREPWEYDDTDLAALCASCHSSEHENRERVQAVLRQVEGCDVTEVVSLLVGLLHGGDLADRVYALVLDDGWGSPRAIEFAIGMRASYDALKQRTAFRFDAEDN